MPDNTTDRPLVTFALFAYNQENYIREAVEGAFAQTYEPLEIILSDDCSTDRTFDIMKEMAANYDGPHDVITRRNFQNLGTAMHVQGVADTMTGKLMVVAAGDDISLPHRVSRVVTHWTENGRCAVMLHSEAKVFFNDDIDDLKAQPLREPDLHLVDLDWYLRNQRNPTRAPTAAYAAELFNDFPPLIGGSVIEDAPLFYRSILCGHIQSIPEPLILYRHLENSAGRGFSVSNINRWNQTLRSRIISEFNQLQDIASVEGLTDSERKLLEGKCRSQIKGLGRCVLSKDSGGQFHRRVQAFLIILLFYPRREKLYIRLAEALIFSNLARTETLKNIKNMLRKIFSV